MPGRKLLALKIVGHLRKVNVLKIQSAERESRSQPSRFKIRFKVPNATGKGGWITNLGDLSWI